MRRHGFNHWRSIGNHMTAISGKKMVPPSTEVTCLDVHIIIIDANISISQDNCIADLLSIYTITDNSNKGGFQFIWI